MIPEADTGRGRETGTAGEIREPTGEERITMADATRVTELNTRPDDVRAQKLVRSRTPAETTTSTT